MNGGQITMGAQCLVRNSTKLPMKIRMRIISRGPGRMLDSVYFGPLLRKYAENRTRKWIHLKAIYCNVIASGAGQFFKRQKCVLICRYSFDCLQRSENLSRFFNP
jgi:hypothetical protein